MGNDENTENSEQATGGQLSHWRFEDLEIFWRKLM